MKIHHPIFLIMPLIIIRIWHYQISIIFLKILLNRECGRWNENLNRARIFSNWQNVYFSHSLLESNNSWIQAYVPLLIALLNCQPFWFLPSSQSRQWQWWKKATQYRVPKKLKRKPPLNRPKFQLFSNLRRCLNKLLYQINLNYLDHQIIYSYLQMFLVIYFLILPR